MGHGETGTGSRRWFDMQRGSVPRVGPRICDHCCGRMTKNLMEAYTVSRKVNSVKNDTEEA